MMIAIKEQINIEEAIQSVYADNAGGVDVFIGKVRDQTKGKQVLELVFEAYEPMAISEMKKIAELAKQKFEISHISIVHTVGVKKVGDTAVVIAVSAPHRKAAFAACEFAIDTLKETVPIWKREVFEDGDVWVAAHP
ncbi:molybdenum cofactor biosynthesis protein MoaE [Limibacter armeniacum]|uniref:molybdenum cofactor biosynthesis protein MoaE n=1 Tax=Limibacter armeniacum TaxID=466084 RepID=UPI002FE50FA2